MQKQRILILLDVIRIDDELYKKINELIKGEKRFDFPSVKSFVDKAVYEKIKEVEKDDKKGKTKMNEYFCIYIRYDNYSKRN